MDTAFGTTPEITHEERVWATFCHLAAFALFLVPPVGQIIAPLVLWLLKRHDSPFIDEHGTEAVNFQISVTLYGIPCFILVFFAIGIPLLLALFVFWFFTVIYASIRTNDGKAFRYPLCIRFL